MGVFPSRPHSARSPRTAAFDLEGPLWIESLCSGWVMVVKLACLFSSWFLSLKNLASSQIVNQSIQLQMLSSADRGSHTQPYHCWTKKCSLSVSPISTASRGYFLSPCRRKKIRDGEKQNRVTWRKGKKCVQKIPVSLQLPAPLPLPPPPLPSVSKG